MTEAIRDYIKSFSLENLWDILHEGDAYYMPVKNKYPLCTEQDVASIYLVGDIERIDEEEEDDWIIRRKVTITAIEFWDWGILPDDDEDDEGEEIVRTEEQIQEIVAEVLSQILEVEVGDYKWAFYDSFRGVNLYRAPLKTPIVLLRTTPLLRPDGLPEEEDIEVTLITEG